MQKWLPLSLRRADIIIAISKSAKNDAVRLFSIPPNKIKVIYPGVTGFFRKLPYANRMRQTVQQYLGINGPFILNCNVISPRKNIETLIQAFQHLQRKKKIKHTLIVVGNTDFYKPKVNNSHNIIFTGNISDRLLLYLYNLADLFVYPSLYEGFGYPPLEAMACGTPVITSNRSSLSEVVGKKGVTVDPRDTQRLSQCMFNILEDKDLRAKMIKNGFERVKYFSEKNQASQTLAVYENLWKN